jgi:phosphopantetheinyl transferase (holo-ACP synthase)
MKIIEKEFNVQTQEETITERDATPAEIAEFEKAQAEAQARQVEAATKEAARKALLDKLGITAEEARLLLGGN